MAAITGATWLSDRTRASRKIKTTQRRPKNNGIIV